jgi:serine/threonine protein kinase
MKMSAIETNALPPGTPVRHFTVADCLGFDQQVCLYRAESSLTLDSVLLYEFLPAGLAARGSHGVIALPGKANALTRELASYTTRLRAAALVGHPALPVLEDIWLENGTVYGVGPWRPGRAFSTDLATRNGPIELKTLNTWTRSVCDALSALHRHDLVHGNLSPGLLRVLDTGELVLPLVGSTRVTEDAPAWTAPEQHPLNPKPMPLGPWTDVYQLCALLHLALTGHAPPSVTRRWEGVPLERLAALSGKYPDAVVNAVRKGLSMHPTTRAPSMDAWLSEAGIPDRRERPRYAENGEAATSEHGDDAMGDAMREIRPQPVGAAVPLRTMPTNSGHMPLSESVEQRLDSLEVERTAPSTPAWVWVAVLMALGALAGLIFLS